jgi:hypothetical protein
MFLVIQTGTIAAVGVAFGIFNNPTDKSGF